MVDSPPTPQVKSSLGVSQSAPQCEGNGLCSSPPLPLDGDVGLSFDRIHSPRPSWRRTSRLFLIHIFTLAWGHYNHANISIPTSVTGAILAGLVATFVFTTTLSLPLLQTILWIVAASVFGAFILSRVMKYLFNSPEMHIWHHAEEWPDDQKHGINFGLTLAVWDYLFGTARIPHDGRDIELGFDQVEQFPKSFISHFFYGFGKHK